MEKCLFCGQEIEPDDKDTVNYQNGKMHFLCDDKAQDYLYDYALAMQDFAEEYD